MNMGWKTKKALLPNWKIDENKISFIGGDIDIGDNG